MFNIFKIDADKKKISEYAHTIHNHDMPISERFAAMLSLRALSSIESIETLIMAFEYEIKSDLLRHEICYSLGQMDTSKKNAAIIKRFFEKIILEDHSEFVRHEAIEALDFVSEDLAMSLLENFKDQNSGILYDTYYVKKRYMDWEKETDFGKSEDLDVDDNKFHSKDPAPFYNYKVDTKYTDIDLLTRILLDNVNYDLFERYRALFTLRELNTEESLMAIC